ncbi:MAG: hypothetical protein ACXWEQ_02170, partial [Halobacteriota archaeon]
PSLTCSVPVCDSTAVSTGAVDTLSSTLGCSITAIPHSLQKRAVGLKVVPQDLHNIVSVINSV